MKKGLIFLLCFAALFTGGCSMLPQLSSSEPHLEDGKLLVGTRMRVELPEELTLRENLETLAADGLYYNTWTDGEAVPYENADGDTVDLYDAQLYLLVCESETEDAAEKNYEKWLASAKENSSVLSQEEILCGEQSYTFLSYSFDGDDSPYARGVSAFAACGKDAVCAEFTCVEDYEKDLKAILTDFLSGCHYDTE